MTLGTWGQGHIQTIADLTIYSFTSQRLEVIYAWGGMGLGRTCRRRICWVFKMLVDWIRWIDVGRPLEIEGAASAKAWRHELAGGDFDGLEWKPERQTGLTGCKTQICGQWWCDWSALYIERLSGREWKVVWEALITCLLTKWVDFNNYSQFMFQSLCWALDSEQSTRQMLWMASH